MAWAHPKPEPRATLKAPKCDVCGCGSGGYTLGILPQLHKNFVGFRYRRQSFDSRENHSHNGGAPESSSEMFQTTELWARFYPMRRLQMLVLLPYQFHRRTISSENAPTRTNGWGDVTVMGNYNLLSNVDSVYRPLKHNWWIGGGMKLPTGQWNRIEDGLTANPNFQLGTGSLDWLLNTIHTIRYANWGMNLDATYRITGQNRNHYQFGNRFSGNATVFYVQKLKSATLMPNAGVYHERFNADRQFGDRVDFTGGAATFANAGVEGYWKNLAAGVLYQIPVKQSLSGGNSLGHNRLTTHVTVMF